MSKVMVAMHDPDGMPRAWAIADDYGKALREAERQLEIYKAKKREVGDELGWATFTPHTSEVQS